MDTEGQRGGGELEGGLERIIGPVWWVFLGGWHFSLSLKFDEHKQLPSLHSMGTLEALLGNTLGSELVQGWPKTTLFHW